jgi:RNA polymerase sigma-70 factor (ECF subfamily)
VGDAARRFHRLPKRITAAAGAWNTRQTPVFLVLWPCGARRNRGIYLGTGLDSKLRQPPERIVTDAHAHEANRGIGVSSFQQSIAVAIPALRRYARALTRDAETADDLVQDTLVRALRSEHLFHGGAVRSWLYTILTNLNRNRLRSLARRPIITQLQDDDAADAAGPEAGGRDIERALALLVEEQRTALLLVVLEGLTYREVAEVQGVPIGTVMSRLARARVQIKAYLDGERPALRRIK